MKTHVHQHLFATAAAALLCTVAQAADYPTTVQSFNPVGYWRLSETAVVPPANILVNSGSLGAAANGYPTPYGITDPSSALIQAQPGVVGTAISFTNPAA